MIGGATFHDGFQPRVTPPDSKDDAVEFFEKLLLEEEATRAAAARGLAGQIDAVDPLQLVCADFSQIEARVLAWLARQQDILDVFASGKDVYVYTANRIGSSNRQLGKVCVLGLGFGMGAVKFILTAASYGLTIDEFFADDTVKAWREANSKIVNFWYDLDDAFRAAIEAPAGSKFPVGYVAVERGHKAVFIRLPWTDPATGQPHRLVYRNARLEPNPKAFHRSKTDIVFDGVQQMSKRWGPIRTYGGKLAENVTQAVARDILAYAMLVLDGIGVDLRLTVHDEIIAVCRLSDAQRTLDLVLQHMRTAPPWAPGFPAWAEGWFAERYRK